MFVLSDKKEEKNENIGPNSPKSHANLFLFLKGREKNFLHRTVHTVQKMRDVSLPPSPPNLPTLV